MDFISWKKEVTIPSVRHTPSQYGLTKTQNGPRIPPSLAPIDTAATANTSIHSSLNGQKVIANVLIPPMDRQAIESQMAENKPTNSICSNADANDNFNLS